MITAVMLLPLTAVLTWIYGYMLPDRWHWTMFDALCLATAVLLGGGWISWARAQSFAGGGPVYGDLVAAAGAYPIFVVVLTVGLALRRARAGQRLDG